ncbi:MAG: FkbM family methyltransferase [Desulfosoma sp.]
MTIISYAQNFEDVMLWRALKHVSHGFYIDVGAWSPDIESVTKVFYERGWRGINIEPNPVYHQMLLEKRPRDINLKIAISDKPGLLEMTFVENSGLSTLSKKLSNIYKEAGWSVKNQLVQVKTLCQVWEDYITDGQEVQFLKIDIEGLEELAIRGNDWTKNRPWIVVVEAMEPMSQVESHHVWEPILLQADYIFAYADGLNRFYVAKERADLLPTFAYPPNVFDGFVLVSQKQAEARAQQAEARAAQAQAREAEAKSQMQQAIQRALHAEERAEEVMKLYKDIINSKSWRITKPLRYAGMFANRLLIGTYAWLTFSPTSIPRRVLEQTLTKAKHYINARPRLKMHVIKVLEHFPKLSDKLQRLEYSAFPSTSLHTLGFSLKDSMDSSRDLQLSCLSSRAQHIYMDLKKAIERTKCPK